MDEVVRLAIVDPHDGSRSMLKSLLMGIDSVWLEAECSAYDFFLDVARQTHPNIALIMLNANPQKGLDLVAQLHEQIPDCCPLVISSSQEGSLILQAMRNGAREFLHYPLSLEDFMAALERIRNSRSGRAGESRARSCQVVAIAGVSGGVGCTALTINLACVLAQQPSHNVAIIDLDLALGDADVWLDIIPDYTVQDVAENITRLDYSLLKRSLTKHECGAFLLPRPVQMSDRPTFTPEELRRVITLLKATFTHLVIDISKSYSPLDLTAMEASDLVLLVTQLDLPCLRNVVRLLQFFDQHDTLSPKIKVLLNRFGLEDSQISPNKALETIGREIYWQIPNDYATMVESRNNGIPLLTHAPKSKLTKAIDQLAQRIGQGDAVETSPSVEETKQRKRLFSFLGSASK